MVCLLRAGTLMPAFSTRQTAAHASDEVYVGLLREEEALRDNGPGSHSSDQANVTEHVLISTERYEC